MLVFKYLFLLPFRLKKNKHSALQIWLANCLFLSGEDVHNDLHLMIFKLGRYEHRKGDLIQEYSWTFFSIHVPNVATMGWPSGFLMSNIVKWLCPQSLFLLLIDHENLAFY